jgi:predicted DNA-binding WGR domain protein
MGDDIYVVMWGNADEAGGIPLRSYSRAAAAEQEVKRLRERKSMTILNARFWVVPIVHNEER